MMEQLINNNNNIQQNHNHIPYFPGILNHGRIPQPPPPPNINPTHIFNIIPPLGNVQVQQPLPPQVLQPPPGFIQQPTPLYYNAAQINRFNEPYENQWTAIPRPPLPNTITCTGTHADCISFSKSTSNVNFVTQVKNHIEKQHLRNFNHLTIDATQEVYHIVSKACSSSQIRYCFTHKKWSKKNQLPCSDNLANDQCYLTSLHSSALTSTPCINQIPNAFNPIRQPLIPVLAPKITMPQIASTHIPVLSRIPSQCIIELSKLLTTLLSQATDLEGITRLHLFGKTILDKKNTNPQGKTSNRITIQSIHAKINRFKSDNNAPHLMFLENSRMWPQRTIQNNLPFQFDKSYKSETPSPQTIARAKYQIGNNCISAAVRSINCTPIAPFSDEISKKLEKLFPWEIDPIIAEPIPIAPIDSPWIVTIEMLTKALKKTDRSTTAGWDGFHPQILLQLLQAQDNEYSLNLKIESASYFSNMLNNKLPQELTHMIMAGNIIACIKNPDEASSYLDVLIRNIVFASSFKRVACAIYNNKLTPKVREVLTYNQVGLNPAGTEQVQHSVRYFATKYPDANFLTSPDNPKAKVIIDIANAFPSISQNEIRNALLELDPTLMPYFSASYDNPPDLYYANHIMRNRRNIIAGIAEAKRLGVNQGMHESTALFCLGLNRTIKRFNQEFPTLDMKLFFFDDATLIGDILELTRAVDWLIINLALIGLKLNLNKCLVGWISNHDAINDEYYNLLKSTFPKFNIPGRKIPFGIFPKEGLNILGSFITTTPNNTHHKNFLNKLYNQIELTHKRCLHLNNAQYIFYIQLYSISYGRYTHLLRSTPNLPGTEEFDLMTKLYFEKNIQFAIDQGTYDDIAALPSRNGGFGLLRTSFLKNISYMVSRIYCFQSMLKILNIDHEELKADFDLYIPPDSIGIGLLQNVPYHDDEIDNNVPVEEQQLFRSIDTEIRLYPQPTKHLQKKILKQYFDTKQHTEYLNSADIKKAHMNTHQYSGQFLHYPLGHQLGTHLSSKQFQILCQLRLNLPMMGFNTLCPNCNKTMDPYGHHAMSCSFGSFTSYWRHNILRDTIIRIANFAKLDPKPEDYSIIPGARADIVIPVFDQRRRYIMDTTVINGLCPSHINKTKVSQDKLLKHARNEKTKPTSAGNLFAALPNTKFEPIPFDMLGNTDIETIEVLKKLTTAHIRISGYSFHEGYTFIMNHIRCAIQRATATMILHRQEADPDDSIYPHRDGLGPYMVW